MEDREHLHSIRRFTTRSEIEKSINTLEGILFGIAIDKKINVTEVAALDFWCQQHFDLLGSNDPGGIVEEVRRAISDGIVTEEEKASILWFAKAARGQNAYWDVVTADLQVLAGMMHGILSDGRVTLEETRNLQGWLFQNDQLTGCYPYDELGSVITGVLKDGRVEPEEERLLKVFFSEFVDTSSIKALDPGELAKMKSEIQIGGFCSLAPDIQFPGNTFCFTGISAKAKRSEIAELVTARAGTFNDRIVNSTNYLIYGDQTNPVWAYSCHGRKVEQAIALRKAGSPIKIVHEVDFWDALQA